MLRRSKPLLFSIALGLLGVTQASAVALPDSAVDCRGTIAKNYAKLMKTAHKTIAACHKSRDGGKTMAGVDCNDMTQADSKSKFSSARTKAEMAISTACAGENATLTSASSGTQFYVSCPVSCAVPNPMTTMAEVATCLGCRAENIAETAGTTALGSPTPSSLTSDDIKCRSALAKGYANVAATAYKTETSCQGDDDEAGDYDIASCVGFDPDSKVSGAQTKADGKVESSCAAAALANLDTCATDTIANLKTCSAAAFASAENDAFEITYEAHATLCPPAVRLTTRSGCSTLEETAGGCSNGGATTSSSSDGWKGYGHDQDLVDAVPLALDVSCPGAFGSCGSCTIGGISTDSVLYDGFARCAASPWIECSNVFDTDAACGGGNCTYFASPPIAQAVGGTPVCLLSRFDEDVSGTVDPDSGSANITMATRSSVYIGIAQQQPCPICEGDATPQDGNANGLCNGGARDGMACDVQGFDLTYATDADAPVSGNSLDCPPSLGLALTGATGIPREIDMKTGSTSKPASDACEAPLNALSCFCGVCSGDTLETCDDDAHCAGMGLGTCGSGGSPGVDRRPNNCGDLTCTAVPGQTDRGQCSSDTAKYCNGMLRADGRGLLPCASDASCDAYVTGSLDEEQWVCPNDNCGDCAAGPPPSCYLDPIVVEGVADPAAPTLAGVSCAPASSNSAVNTAYGLPGPVTMRMETILERRY